MYALVMLLSLLMCATFVAAFALRPGRRWTVGFALATVALLYTHNWGLFLGAGLAVGFGALLALAEDRRALLREGLIAFAVIAVAYAPWVPTLLFQSAHTGAPWARPPDFETLTEAPANLLGFTGQYLLLVGAGAGLASLAAGRRWTAEGRAALVLAIAGVLALAIPWVHLAPCRRRGRPATPPSRSARCCCWRRSASPAPGGSASPSSRWSPCCGSPRTSRRRNPTCAPSRRASPRAWRPAI